MWLTQKTNLVSLYFKCRWTPAWINMVQTFLFAYPCVLFLKNAKKFSQTCKQKKERRKERKWLVQSERIFCSSDILNRILLWIITFRENKGLQQFQFFAALKVLYAFHCSTFPLASTTPRVRLSTMYLGPALTILSVSWCLFGASLPLQHCDAPAALQASWPGIKVFVDGSSTSSTWL